MAQKYPSDFNRRHFLTGLGTTTASASISPAEATEVMHIGPRKRLESDIEGWNVGLITAHRPELSLAENIRRNSTLQGEIRKGGFGLLHWHGQYIPSAGIGPIDQHAFLVIGRADDSGNLKGFLRKAGRKFNQDGVVWKGYYRDVLLFTLKDLPGLGTADGDVQNLGRFHPHHIARYHALMTRPDSATAPWNDFGIWTQPTFLNRASRRLVFDERGNRIG
jgi:hypothetical protein